MDAEEMVQGWNRGKKNLSRQKDKNQGKKPAEMN